MNKRTHPLRWTELVTLRAGTLLCPKLPHQNPVTSALCTRAWCLERLLTLQAEGSCNPGHKGLMGSQQHQSSRTGRARGSINHGKHSVSGTAAAHASKHLTKQLNSVTTSIVFFSCQWIWVGLSWVCLFHEIKPQEGRESPRRVFPQGKC